MFGRSNSKPANPVRFTQDASGAAAVDLSKVPDAGLVSLSKTVGVSLQKRGLAGMRGRVIVLLDHSGSMYGDFASGAVQKLLEKALAFGLQVDTDGAIEVIPFDSRVHSTQTVGLSNYQSAVQNIWKQHNMGSTDLTGALKALRDIAKDTKEPIIAMILTDGAPNDPNSAEELVCDLARYPVFLKFVALRSVPYLSRLDDLEKYRPNARILDNVDTQDFPNPDGVTPEDFAEKMTEEWDGWTQAALSAGVLHR